MGPGVLSAPRGTAVLPSAVSTSGHWIPPGEVQPGFAEKAGSGLAAPSSRHRPEPSGSCQQLRVCASGWRLVGGGGRRRACCLPAWLCCGLLSLARCLSQPTSQEFTPEPKRQACESPSAPPATAPSPSSAPRLKGAAPRQQARPGQGARSQPGQLSWTRRAPSGKCSCLVSCPGWPHAGPWRGCGIWDSAWTSRS